MSHLSAGRCLHVFARKHTFTSICQKYQFVRARTQAFTNKQACARTHAHVHAHVHTCAHVHTPSIMFTPSPQVLQSCQTASRDRGMSLDKHSSHKPCSCSVSCHSVCQFVLRFAREGYMYTHNGYKEMRSCAYLPPHSSDDTYTHTREKRTRILRVRSWCVAWHGATR